MKRALSRSGSQHNCAWRIHHNISKALVRSFKRFKNEAASQISHEVFNIACEDEDLVTQEILSN